MTPGVPTQATTVPPFSLSFPAKPLQTTMDWRDLVVSEPTALQLETLRLWLQHGHTLSEEWGLKRNGIRGYRALFYGPPGSGKTLSAALLGKLSNLAVYRIDLSLVVSKYIGETEKNMEGVFRKAEGKNWILFFDEAESLFAKRTNIGDAHDKYANQEVAYLLQRLEEYRGLAIFSFNRKTNIDEAFLRRFSSIIRFLMPTPEERVRLWQQAFSPACEPPSKEELAKLAEGYALTGGAIQNAIEYASLKAIDRGDRKIAVEDLSQGIKQLQDRLLEW
jgi:SpoVK/Ycf46/Vps4 family AAA+-type ATPase